MTDPCLSIRPYRAESDFTALSAIWFDASREAHGFIGQDRLTKQRQRVERDYLPVATTFVACFGQEPGQEPVGFIALMGDFIGGLFVRPDMQGHGIGRKLMTHVLNRIEAPELEVYTANRQALGFYQALGFVELSRRDSDDDGLPFENVRMRYQR